MNPIIKVFRSKINMAIILLITVLIIGVIGYKTMTNYSWVDALYMTVITITTVGFGEVRPLDEETKIFTIILILTSVVIVGYALKVITEYIIERNSEEDLKLRKMEKKAKEMKGHVVICGFGRNGKQAAQKLLSYEQEFLIIENDKEVIERNLDSDFSFIHGDANDDEILIKAGVEYARCLISALPDDSDNLFVVLSAKQLNPNLKIISRASAESTYKKLKFAGADNVVLPDRIGGDHMATLVVVPDLIEFMDNLSFMGERNINIEEIEIEKLYDPNPAKSIQELDLRKKTGCTVIGYKKPDGSYLINPEAAQLLESGSKIIVLGRPEQIENLNSIFNI